MPDREFINSRLAEAIAKLATHDHAALIFETAAEKLDVLVPFLSVGLRRGERCLHLVPSGEAARALGELDSAGIDTAEATARGALVLATPEAFPPAGEEPACSHLFAFLAAGVAEAKAAGFRALRFSQEKSWMVMCGYDMERLVRHQTQMNDFVAAHDVTVLCGYDSASFSDDILLSVVQTHPVVIFRRVVLHNYNYLPPDQFLGPHRLRHQVAHLLSGMSEWESMLEDMRMQGALLRAIFESTSDALYIKDLEGRYILINRAGAAILGATPQEVIGRRDSDLLPPHEAAAFSKANNDALASATPVTVEVTVTLGATTRTLLTTKGRYTDETGKVTGVYAIARDITERKRREAEIAAFQEKLRQLAGDRSRVEEQERRRIATALHDQIGQTLALAKIKLQSLESPSDEESHREINQVCDLLDAAIKQTRSLTVELSPPILYELGLDAALSVLCDDFGQQHGLQVIYCGGECKRQIPEDLRALLFQAVRELLVNVVKHARAHRVEVTVIKEEEEVRIVVADDGIGCDGETAQLPGSAFGLFNLRERLKYYGGQVALHAAPGRGTTVTVRAPIRPPNSRLETAQGKDDIW